MGAAPSFQRCTGLSLASTTLPQPHFHLLQVHLGHLSACCFLSHSWKTIIVDFCKYFKYICWSLQGCLRAGTDCFQLGCY